MAGHAAWSWYTRLAIADSESPSRTVYVADRAEAVATAFRAEDSSWAGVRPTRACEVSAVRGRGAIGGLCETCVLAMACGDMQSTAAAPASAGTATAVRRAIWVRFSFLWQPKGLLSEQGALPGKAAQQARGFQERLTARQPTFNARLAVATAKPDTQLLRGDISASQAKPSNGG